MTKLIFAISLPPPPLPPLSSLLHFRSFLSFSCFFPLCQANPPICLIILVESLIKVAPTNEWTLVSTVGSAFAEHKLANKCSFSKVAVIFDSAFLLFNHRPDTGIAPQHNMQHTPEPPRSHIPRTTQNIQHNIQHTTRTQNTEHSLYSI